MNVISSCLKFFLQLIISFVRTEAERIEAEVPGLTARAPEHLVDPDGGDDFEQPEPEQQLAHRARRDTSVVGLHSTVGMY